MTPTITLPGWALHAAGTLALLLFGWFTSRVIRGVDRRQDECESRDQAQAASLQRLETSVELQKQRADFLEHRLIAAERTNELLERLIESRR